MLGVPLRRMQWFETGIRATCQPTSWQPKVSSPFVDDAQRQHRGSNQWHACNWAQTSFTLGQSQAQWNIAEPFFYGASQPLHRFWLTRDAETDLPATLTEPRQTDCPPVGQQVIAQFDAGVTRQHRH